MIWAKRFGILLLSITALFIALIVYVTVFVNPNDFKDTLQDAAKQQANIELRLDGDINWSFFPWLGIELENIGIAFSGESEIIEFGKAEFGVAILPLLSKTINVDRVKLIDLKTNLMIDEKGQANWQRTNLESTTTSISTPAPQVNSTNANASTSTSEKTQSSTLLPTIHLSELAIENAQIHYTDATSDLVLSAMIDLSLYDVQWGRAWPLTMSVDVTQTNLSDKAAAATNLTADLSGNITVSPEQQTFKLTNLSINNQIIADFLPVSPLASELAIAQLEVDLANEKVELTQLSISSLGLDINLNAQATNVLSNPSFHADLQLEEFTPSALFKALAIELPTAKDTSVFSRMNANMKMTGNTQTIALSEFQLNFDDSTLAANADIQLSPLSWRVDIKGNNLDVDRYLPEKNDDDTKAEASSAVTKTSAEDPSSEMSLAATGTTDTGETKAADLIPVELVRMLNGQIDFNWSNLKVANLLIDTIEFSSTQNNGLVTVHPLSASLYKGVIALDATLDARENTPKIMLKPNIQDVQIQPLLLDLTDTNKVAGITDLKGEINTQGNTIDNLIKNANGNLVIQVLDGALVGTNLTKSVCEGIAKNRNEALDESVWNNDTPFESLNFPANIHNGEVSTPGLKIQAAGIKVTGDGVISLPKSSFNYTTNIGLTGSTLDKACRIKEEFQTLTFPVICSGKFTDAPASLCRPDLKGFAKQFAKLAEAKLKIKAGAEKARAKEKLKEKAKAEADRLKKRLKSLF